jgi:hypothetical protein
MPLWGVSPSNGVEAPGESAGGDERQAMVIHAFQIVGLIGLERCVPDLAVSLLGLFIQRQWAYLSSS